MTTDHGRRTTDHGRKAAVVRGLSSVVLFLAGYRKHTRNLLQHLLALLGVVALNGGGHAGAEMVVEQQGADLAEGRLHGLNLLDDVDAISIIGHHALDAADVAGGAGESLDGVLFAGLVHSSCVLCKYPPP